MIAAHGRGWSVQVNARTVELAARVLRGNEANFDSRHIRGDEPALIAWLDALPKGGPDA